MSKLFAKNRIHRFLSYIYQPTSPSSSALFIALHIPLQAPILYYYDRSETYARFTRNSCSLRTSTHPASISCICQQTICFWKLAKLSSCFSMLNSELISGGSSLPSGFSNHRAVRHILYLPVNMFDHVAIFPCYRPETDPCRSRKSIDSCIEGLTNASRPKQHLKMPPSTLLTPFTS